jgi:hypothetical protein
VVRDRQLEAQALIDLADSGAHLGGRDEALAHAHNALDIARRIEAPLLERQARAGACLVVTLLRSGAVMLFRCGGMAQQGMAGPGHGACP